MKRAALGGIGASHMSHVSVCRSPRGAIPLKTSPWPEGQTAHDIDGRDASDNLLLFVANAAAGVALGHDQSPFGVAARSPSAAAALSRAASDGGGAVVSGPADRRRHPSAQGIWTPWGPTRLMRRPPCPPRRPRRALGVDDHRDGLALGVDAVRHHHDRLRLAHHHRGDRPAVGLAGRHDLERDDVVVVGVLLGCDGAVTSSVSTAVTTMPTGPGSAGGRPTSALTTAPPAVPPRACAAAVAGAFFFLLRSASSASRASSTKRLGSRKAAMSAAPCRSASRGELVEDRALLAGKLVVGLPLHARRQARPSCA